MHTENVALHRQNRELQDKLDAANAQLRDSPDPAQFKTLQAELLDRDHQITDLRNQRPADHRPGGRHAAGHAAAPSPFGDLETSVDARAGTVTVTLPGDVLFASGQATLRPSAEASLAKVASALQGTYAGRPIHVEGHTDADPIVRTKQEWDDNLELSLARAAAVSRYLEAHGIRPNRSRPAASAPTAPAGPARPATAAWTIVVVMR